MSTNVYDHAGCDAVYFGRGADVIGDRNATIYNTSILNM